MAKSEATRAKPEKAVASKAKYDEWEVRDAMHTMMRAGEIVKDKKLMGHVRKHAAEHAKKSAEVAERARHLAKSGRISEKQMAKLDGKEQGGHVRDLDKMRPVA
jgi:hypothetical protein